MYIDTGSPVPNIPSKSRGLADENKSFCQYGNVDNINEYTLQFGPGSKCVTYAANVIQSGTRPRSVLFMSFNGILELFYLTTS